LDSANVKLSELAQQRTPPAADARALAAPATAGSSAGDLRSQLDTLRKKVWALESERNELQQKLAAFELSGQNPGLAERKAREESGAKLAAALQSAKMLRDENDQLKATVAQANQAKAEAEASLAKARALLPLATQAGNLREQLNQAQAQAAQLIEENSRLKTRLATARRQRAPPR
jgi:chromosome segregation ATPase